MREDFKKKKAEGWQQISLWLSPEELSVCRQLAVKYNLRDSYTTGVRKALEIAKGANP